MFSLVFFVLLRSLPPLSLDDLFIFGKERFHCRLFKLACHDCCIDDCSVEKQLHVDYLKISLNCPLPLIAHSSVDGRHLDQVVILDQVPDGDLYGRISASAADPSAAVYKYGALLLDRLSQNRKSELAKRSRIVGDVMIGPSIEPEMRYLLTAQLFSATIVQKWPIVLSRGPWVQIIGKGPPSTCDA
uniref:Uncharacterized protein n=1 Tax=Meloidogyne incognita TaxID=6306 RepID=A0A914MKE7_MELIC